MLDFWDEPPEGHYHGSTCKRGAWLRGMSALFWGTPWQKGRAIAAGPGRKRAAKRVPLPPRILNPILVSYMDGHPLPDIPAHITAYTLPTDHSASSLQPSLCRILCLSGGQRTLHFHCMNP